MILGINNRPINTLLKRYMNQYVIVRLKDNTEYRGKMIKCDTYMNIILNGSTEYNRGKPITKYGKIFVRGNNVLYICLDSAHSI